MLILLIIDKNGKLSTRETTLVIVAIEYGSISR
jgi:hypothetical protein